MQPFSPAEVTEAQALAEAAMREACVASRPTGQVVTDPETGEDSPVLEQVLIKGKCRVKLTGMGARNDDAGEHVYLIGRPVIVLPIGDPVRAGDLIKVIASTEQTLPASPVSVGTVFRLTDPERATFVTAQRWAAEELIA